jgi:hypothetical protein
MTQLGWKQTHNNQQAALHEPRFVNRAISSAEKQKQTTKQPNSKLLWMKSDASKWTSLSTTDVNLQSDANQKEAQCMVCGYMKKDARDFEALRTICRFVSKDSLHIDQITNARLPH